MKNTNQKSFLVVDDDQEIIQKIRILLTINLDCKIDIVYNGKEALDKMVESEPYDLLILAILIPKLDGIEVLQSMIQDEKLKKIPVLLTSILPLDSEAFHKSLEKFDEFSVVKDILEKPFSDKDLLAKVKAIITQTFNYSFQQ